MSEARHIILSLCVFAAVVLAAGGLLVWPTHGQTRELRHQEAALQRRLDNLHLMTAQVEQFGRELSDARRAIETELKHVPESPDVAELMRRLSLPVDGASVHDQTFTAGLSGEAVGPDLPTHVLPLTVDMQATFDAVFDVLRRAERMDRLVRVSAVRLSVNREKPPATSGTSAPTRRAGGAAAALEIEGTPPLLVATIGLEAVFEPPASGAPASDAPPPAQRGAAPARR
jgi:hypothetical protein